MKTIYKFAVILFLASISFLLPESARSQNAPRKVLFIYDGANYYYDKAISLIEKELEKIAPKKYKIVGKKDGQWWQSLLKAYFEDSYANKNVDVVVALGFISTNYLLNRRDIPKPTIIADFIDEPLVSSYTKDGHSTVNNLTFLATKDTVKDDIFLFKKLVNFSRLTILGPKLFSSYLEYLKKEIESYFKIKVKLIYYCQDLAVLFDSLKNSQAVYITPAVKLSQQNFRHLVSLLNQHKIPTFSMMGYIDVKDGVLAGSIPKLYVKYGRHVALMVERVLEGENPKNIKVNFPLQTAPLINLETASLLGVNIPFDLAIEAQTIGKTQQKGKVLTVKEAVKKALENNFLFKIKEEEIKEARSHYRSYLSLYLPHIYSNIEYHIYDSRQLPIATGLYPQREANASIMLSQIIFSDPLLCAIKSKKYAYRIEGLKKEALRRDVTYEVICAYLDYLKAKVLLEAKKKHLKTVSYYLEVAKTKKKSGLAAKEEVLRWRSEKAQAQALLIKAQSDLRKARNVINQLMNIGQEEKFVEQKVEKELAAYYLDNRYLLNFINNFPRLEILIEFFLNKALGNCPELKVLSLAQKAQEKQKDTALRRFFLPQVSLQASYNYALSQKYKREDFDTSLLGTDLDNPRDEWETAVKLNYPLFEGGRKFSGYAAQKAALNKLRFQYRLKAQELELRIREAVYNIYYSWANVDFSREALKNASKNLAILQQKYAAGVVSITDLVNAEEDEFLKEQKAAISVYQFLQGLAFLDRYAGSFYCLGTNKEKDVLVKEIENYFEAKGELN